MFKKILCITALSLAFVGSAQAYEVTKTVGYSMSTGSSVSKYRVSGEIKTTIDQHRKVYDFDSGELTLGDVTKHQVVRVEVKQHGTTYGSNGSATLYAGIEFGNIEAGFSATIGSESSNGVAYDNSKIHQNGTDVIDLKTYAFVPFRVQVGSYREVTFTDTEVQLANSSHTQTHGGYVSKSAYIK